MFNKLKIIIVILLLAAFSVFLFAYGQEYNKEDTDKMVAEVTENFINIFWDAKKNYFYHNNTQMLDLKHFSGPLLGLYTDFWLEAQNWETVMDIYDRQGTDFYKDMIDRVYDGFLHCYPDFTKNMYYDDIGWWAMGCTRAYTITGDSRYLNDAKTMFDYIYTAWSEDIGGALFWNTNRTEKNVCTNCPAATTAARLSVLLNDQSYLQKAVEIFDWVNENLYDRQTGKLNDTKRIDGSISQGQYSYNYGTFAGAAYELYTTTADKSYLEYVTKPLDYLLATKATEGILHSEGDGDGSAFRTIYLRTLNRVKTLKSEYQEIINKNALATYNNRRESDKLNGHDWTKPPAENDIIMSTLVATSVSLMQFYVV